MNFLLRFVQTLTAWVLPRPMFIIALAIILAAGSLTLSYFKLDLQTDQLELISPDHPLVALTDRLRPFNFGGRTPLTIVVQASKPERAVRFIKVLAEKIEADRVHFQDFFYRVDPEIVKRWALLYLEKGELEQLRDDIKEYSGTIRGLTADPDLLTFLKMINQEMAARMIGEFFTGFLEDDSGPEKPDEQKEPMDLSVLIATLEGVQSYLNSGNGYKSPWASLFKNTSWNLDLEGYFWEADKKYLLSFVVPSKNGGGFSPEQVSLELLRELIRETRKSFPDVKAGVTGQKALNVDEMSTAMEDMDRATLLSLGGVMLLMVVFLCSFRRPLAEMITLGLALCWTIGLTTLLIGHLNILSVVFAPLLCGLGVDYGIHWFARYEEEENQIGPDPKEVTWRVTNRSGPGILLAGLSAVFCFLPLVLTGFQGLMELGVITGLGIFLIVLADFTVLPAVNFYLAGGMPCKVRAFTANHRDLFHITPRIGMVVIAAAALLSLVSIWGTYRVRFDLNPLRLQTANAESVYWEKELIENSQRSLISAAVFANSPAEVEAKSDLLKKLSTVSEVESIFDLLPGEQEEKIPILHSLLPEIPEIHTKSIETRREDLKELVGILERIRFKMQEEEAAKWGAKQPLLEQMNTVRRISEQIITLVREKEDQVLPAFTEYRRKFQKDLVDTWDFLRDAASASPMSVMELPKFLRDWFYRDGVYLIRIYPKESVWEQDALERFVQQLQGVDPEVVGDPVSLYVFAGAYRNACVNAAIYALIIILVLLLITYRSLPLAVLALLPLLMGTLWTVGIMGAVGVDFNLANGVFMPLVVGAGVEYGVIILNRWKEGTMLPGQLPLSTGKGVILAALTTTLGFGTLMISHHQGIFSLGFISLTGSLCVLVSAISVIPAALALVPVRKPEYLKESLP